MKKSLFIFSLFFSVGFIAKAQNHNTLWCDKNPQLKNTHHLNMQKPTEAGKLNAIMKWGGPKGGSTFTAANLEIINGSCESCPQLGAIGSGNYQQKWVIKVNDVSKPVTFAWKTTGTINMCGTGKLNVRR